MSHVLRVCLVQLYKSSSVCFSTDSHRLLPFNIPSEQACKCSNLNFMVITSSLPLSVHVPQLSLFMVICVVLDVVQYDL